MFTFHRDFTPEEAEQHCAPELKAFRSLTHVLKADFEQQLAKASLLTFDLKNRWRILKEKFTDFYSGIDAFFLAEEVEDKNLDRSTPFPFIMVGGLVKHVIEFNPLDPSRGYRSHEEALLAATEDQKVAILILPKGTLLIASMKALRFHSRYAFIIEQSKLTITTAKYPEFTIKYRFPAPSFTFSPNFKYNYTAHEYSGRERGSIFYREVHSLSHRLPLKRTSFQNKNKTCMYLIASGEAENEFVSTPNLSISGSYKSAHFQKQPREHVTKKITSYTREGVVELQGKVKTNPEGVVQILE